MTITDSPTTTDQVWSVTEQSITSGSQNKKTPTKQIDRVPQIDAVESVAGLRFVRRVLEANRQLAMTWMGSMGLPSEVTREQAESHRQFLPEQRPTLAECTTTRAETAQDVADEQVAQARPNRTDRAQDPDAGAGAGAGATCHTDQRIRGRPGSGIIDGLIGHLLDLDIVESLSTNHLG